MNEGHLKLIAEIREEYADRGRVIEQEEKKLQEKYDDLKEEMPDDMKQMFAKQKQLNKEEEEKRVREVEEQNKAEVSRRFRSMKEKATSSNVSTEEDRNRQQVKDKYEGERAWLKNQTENRMTEEEAKDYNDNINLAEQKEQHARLLSELNDFNQKRETIIAEWEAKKETAEAVIESMPELGDDNLIARLEEERQKALGALGTEELLQSEAWTGLFDHLDELTISQIDKLIGDVQAKMEIQETLGVDNAKISPVDMKVITGKLGEAKQQIAQPQRLPGLGRLDEGDFRERSGRGGGCFRRGWRKMEETGEGHCGAFSTSSMMRWEVAVCCRTCLASRDSKRLGMIQGVATAGIAMASAIEGVEGVEQFWP